MSGEGEGTRQMPSTVRRGAVCCLLAASLLAGCTAARSSLGTSDSSCFLALPAATRAVGSHSKSHSKLIGVHLYTLDDLRHLAPGFFTIFPNEHPSTQRVCVMAYSGTFTSSSVSKPLGRPAGPVAVVVMETPANRLLGTVILRHVPLHFSHSHIG